METERLIIDPIRETDQEDYFLNISHDKKVLETFICRYADTLEEFDFSSYPGRRDLFAIRLKETERLIGILSLFDEKDGACEIGYGIGSRFWNRGYATEAVRRFLEYLFREKGMRRVCASFFTGNDASRRVMEKCGMTYDHFTEKELTYLGVERDLTYYAIRRKPEVILLNSLEEPDMNRKALVVIDIQNDITRHYRDILDRLNAAIEWAAESGMEIVYIQHNNLSPGTRTFKPGTKGAELVPELRIVSDHIFVKTKANALTSEAFSEFIRSKELREFYITGADATACVKSTCFNMAKAGYAVHVISDCVTSYDLKKLPEMFAYYSGKGCELRTLAEYQSAGDRP
ncbi:MAG: isochorismatase family protein [Oscillospiraceae bacterium]|nr:isochorismatase family protein [Oscillospiraceae bacterium]